MFWALGQGPYLEMCAPTWIWGGYAELSGSYEPEAGVEALIAEQRNQGLAKGVSRTDHGVHERASDPLPLLRRNNGDRSQRERREISNPTAGTDNVTNDLLANGRHE